MTWWRIAGWGLALLALANAGIVVALWWRAAGAGDLDGTAAVLVEASRLTGLLGAYLVLVELLLLARLPLLDRLVGFDRLMAWHRRNGAACVTLLLAHAVLITVGYALADRISLPAEVERLVTGYAGVITAIAGLVLLVAVVVSSIVIARRRLRYETWYFVHLYAYLGVALAFSHQLATGTAFIGEPAARAYWYGLYGATLAAIAGFRIVRPARAQPAPRPPRGARGRGDAGRRLGRGRRRPPGPDRCAHGPVLHLALPHARPLVGGAPVLALRRARRAPATDHGQGRRRLHVAAARDTRPGRA